MTMLTENPHHGSFILSIADEGNLSVDNGLVAAAAAVVLQPGTVLGKVSASGKYLPLNPAASDGSQNFAGILVDRTDATAADAKCVVLSRHAEVYASGLIWASGVTAPQIASVLAQAAAELIVAR